MVSTASKAPYFSTIKEKAELADEQKKRNQQQQLVSNCYGRLDALIFKVERLKNHFPHEENTSQVKFLKISEAVSFAPLSLREILTFTNQTMIQIILSKKGKLMGKSVYRDVTLNRTETDLFQITQEKHNKSYDAPTEFISETKEEYKQKLANKADKKKIMSWEAKEIADTGYRIMFKRGGTSEGDSLPDTAFYFKTRQDWEKTRNYLKFIKVLEIENSVPEKPNIILERLDKVFKEQLISKIRYLIKIRANIIQTELYKIKLKKVQISPLLNELNKDLAKIFTNTWLKYAIDYEALKKERERLAQVRKEGLESTIKTSTFLKTLDDSIGKHFLKEWKCRVEGMFATDRRDIKISFNTLELVSDVIQPSIKLEIRFKKDYPEIPIINGVQIFNRYIEFDLSCKVMFLKSSRVSCWSIFPQQKAIEIKGTYQNKQLNNTITQQFSLLFNGFRTEYMDCVDIKVILYDETRTIIGYHYAVLKSMHAVADYGKEIWLCLKPSSEGRTKFPLIHLTIRVNLPVANQKSLPKKELENVSRDPNYIEDTFYNYKFKFPIITPKQAKLLELYPASWELFEKETSKSPPKPVPKSDFVQVMRTKLSNHYYKTTARQIAHLTKSAFLWAELQEDLMSMTKDSICINAQQLKTIVRKKISGEEIGLEETSPQQENPDNIVSYLFKRDQWEKKAGWEKLYEKLKRICKKGIPSQYRISFWSELGKVAYFIELTESLLRLKGVFEDNQQGSTKDPENLFEKSKKIYEILQKRSENENTYLDQALEDDLIYLQDLQGKPKLAHERELRKICKTFITWSKIVSDVAANSKISYHIAYSRSITTICYGLIVCQTCRYIEDNFTVEADQLFWLLVSLTTYILSTYYENNEQVAGTDMIFSKSNESNNETKKKYSLKKSALRTIELKGIKSDLNLLKVMLKEAEQDIYSKFEEFGMPLEYYFGEHMVTLFFNLFNPGLAFRCWDIIFFEGSGSNGVKCNKMIVCIIFALLKECKQQIVKAKRAEDLKFIIELSGRFNTKYGDIIKKAYMAFNNCLEVNLPANPSVLDRLTHLKNLIFTDIHKNINKDISHIESTLENHFQPIYQQNLNIYNLANTHYNYRPGHESEPISYLVIKKMIQDLHSTMRSKHGNLFSQRNIRSLHIKIHSLVLNSAYKDKASIILMFGFEKVTKNNVSLLNSNVEAEFMITSSEDLSKGLMIEIYTQTESDSLLKIGSANIELRPFSLNVVTKLNLKLEEDAKMIDNIPPSEIVLSILLQGAELEESTGANSPFVLSSLENVKFNLIYKTLRKLNYGNTEASEKSDSDMTPENSPLSDKGTDKCLISHNSSSLKWKEKFSMAFDSFLEVIKVVVPVWVGSVDFNLIYNSITESNQSKKFYITDFFALLVICAKLTLNQRLNLLFELLVGFNVTSPNEKDKIPIHMLKGLSVYLYEAFMVYIPQNEIENMLDFLCSGSSCYVKKIVLNGNHKLKADFPRQIANRIANYMHLYAGSREVNLNSQSFIKLLRDFYEKEVIVNLKDKPVLHQERNELVISYFTNGMNHKVKLFIDGNWKLIDFVSVQGNENIGHSRFSEALQSNQNVLCLNNYPSSLTKTAFLNITKNLPLIDYLSSLENVNFPSFLTSLHDIKFTVSTGEENLYSTKLSHSSNFFSEDQRKITYSKDPRPEKKRKFSYYMENWAATVRRAQNLLQKNLTVQRVHDAWENMTSNAKINIYMSYSKTMKYIKKEIIKRASAILDKSKDYPANLHPGLFNESIWTLDFQAALKINNNQFIKVKDISTTPFTTLIDYLEQAPALNQKEIYSLEILFSLQYQNLQKENIEPKYDHIAIFRYPDHSYDWLPCDIKFVFQHSNSEEKTIGQLSNKEFDGYGLIFQRFPKEVVLKPKEEVSLSYKTDLSNIEFRKVQIFESS